MTNFEKWSDRYKKNWCTKEQLQKLLTLEVLTQAEYNEIVTQ